jgi:hypothetical protein
MKKSTASLVYSVIFLLLAAILVARFERQISSISSDLAHHYALVKEYFDFGARTLRREYLGEFNSYPGGSHWIIAHLALATSTEPLTAIGAWSVFCLFTFWAAFFFLVLPGTKKKVSALPAATIFLILAFLWHHHLTVGAEVLNNFFLPQLTGEVIEILVAVAIIKSGVSAPLRVLGVVAAGWLLSVIHGIPSVEIFFVFGFFAILVGRGLKLRLVLFEICGLLTGLATIVLLSPDFKAMREISNAEGYVSLTWDYRVLAGVLFVIGVASAVFCLIRNSKSARAIGPEKSLIFAFALGSISFLLLQGLAFGFLGLGSAYAVKKHLFTASTYAVPATYLIISERFRLFRSWDLPRAAVPLFLAFLLFWVGVPRRGKFDESRVVDDIRILRATPGWAFGQLVVVDTAVPPELNYLMTIGEARLPRWPVSLTLLQGRYDDLLRELPEHPGVDLFVISGASSKPMLYKSPSFPRHL